MGLSELEIKVMAKTAASHYVNKQVPLHDSVVKMASEKDMNAWQIARLCESANLDTFDSLYKKLGSCDFSFDVADQDKVVDAMNKKAEAHLPDDFEVDPGDMGSLLYSDEHNVVDDEEEEEKMKKAASFYKEASAHFDIGPGMARITNTRDKLAHYVSMIDAAVAENQVHIGGIKIALTEMLKTAHRLGEPIGGTYRAALSRARSSEDLQAIKEAMAEVSINLKQYGIDYAKEASIFSESATGGQSEVDTDNDLPKPKAKDYAVVTSHPFIKHIDTLVEDTRHMREAKPKKDFIVTKIEFLDKNSYR